MRSNETPDLSRRERALGRIATAVVLMTIAAFVLTTAAAIVAGIRPHDERGAENRTARTAERVRR